MSLSAVLLRMLLCLGLVLNGLGVAAASAGPMAHAHAPGAALENTATTARGSAEGVDPPCHEDSMPTPVPQSPGDQPSDCCESGECPGDCVHQVQVIVDAPGSRNVVIASNDRLRSMMPAHAPPVLPQLIRPPIDRVS